MDGFEVKDKYGLYDLVALTALLRDPDRGCPWDKQQTHASIRQNFIEETYEAVDAIDRGNTDDLREELGDVLLQVMLHCEMERELGLLPGSVALWPFLGEYIKYAAADPEFRAQFLKNLAMGGLFAGLGLFGVLRGKMREENPSGKVNVKRLGLIR